ncbi:hypothetical protein [Acinetobacter baumannii]|uniref:hypothetical protein n=1 Tax=Acinetobacter baumannii TaxID=470 RepID=UPI0024DE9B86|nr:hypothetical protein [Acinetobacter baumannii]MDK2220912.1 hypothetical protein [Acinetobacter baumannii]MDK2231951.1 hypothetical protein [Acinetobacter baumannii]MDP7921449.1 hypothetical protein [Acinetobacter baumannii]HCQ9867926.1 hypothetical protein [Acinetobacter baumannii]
MSVSNVIICNNALSRIGGRQIASFDENTELAQLCRNNYDITRLSLLRAHPWSCAKKRQILSPISTYPSFGYGHAFPLPSDYVRVLAVNTERYEIENRYILADTETVYLEYIFDNKVEQTWDSMLIEAITLKMAYILCKPVTGSSAERDALDQEFARLIAVAKNVNGQERPSQDVQYAESSYYWERF